MKEWGDSSDSLSESESDYCVDGYMFGPKRSDDSSAGHVIRFCDDSDSDEAIVLVAWTTIHPSV